MSSGIVARSQYEAACEFICRTVPELLESWNEACRERERLWLVVEKLVEAIPYEAMCHPGEHVLTEQETLKLIQAAHNARGMRMETYSSSIRSHVERYREVDSERRSWTLTDSESEG